MAENTFEIILQTTDNATEGIRKVKSELNGVSQETTQLSATTTTAGKNIQEQFKEASSQAREFRKSLFIVTAAFAGMVAATREAAKYNEEARTSYDNFTMSVRQLAVELGTVFAPALEAVSNIVNFLNNSIEGALAGLVKISSFLGAFFESLKSGPIQAYKDAMNIANQQTDEFLNKVETTRQRVSTGMTFDKEAKGVVNLETITVKASKTIKAGWDQTIQTLGGLSSAMSSASSMSKSWAKAAGVVAIGMAIANTALGITAALSGPPNGPPWPFNIAMAALVAATGAIQIATISAQSFHTGGMIRAHNGLAVDEVPIIAQTGEGVLSRRGMSALGGAGALNRLNSGGGAGSYIHIEVNYPTVRSDADIDKLTEEISQRLSREAERL